MPPMAPETAHQKGRQLNQPTYLSLTRRIQSAIGARCTPWHLVKVRVHPWVKFPKHAPTSQIPSMLSCLAPVTPVYPTIFLTIDPFLMRYTHTSYFAIPFSWLHENVECSFHYTYAYLSYPFHHATIFNYFCRYFIYPNHLPILHLHPYWFCTPIYISC